MENQADQPKRHCAICGGQDMPGFGVCSSVTLLAGYNSDHDGMKREVPVCGSCLDWLWRCMAKNGSDEVEDSVWFSWNE